MPETTKISPGEWWQYECRATHQAWLEMGKTQFFISIGGAMLSGGFALAMGWRNQHDAMVVCFSTVFGLVGVFLIQFAIKLFAAPAKMDKENRQKASQEAKESKEKLAECYKEKTRALELANSRFDKEETEHTKADLRKAVKDLLGRWLGIIEGQISHVKLMDWNGATEANRLKEISYWSDVSVEISVFLKEQFSEAESALFKSQSDMRRTPVNNELDWPKKQRQLLLDQMTHGSKQLRSIIEKLI